MESVLSYLVTLYSLLLWWCSSWAVYYYKLRHRKQWWGHAINAIEVITLS